MRDNDNIDYFRERWTPKPYFFKALFAHVQGQSMKVVELILESKTWNINMLH